MCCVWNSKWTNCQFAAQTVALMHSVYFFMPLPIYFQNALEPEPYRRLTGGPVILLAASVCTATDFIFRLQTPGRNPVKFRPLLQLRLAGTLAISRYACGHHGPISRKGHRILRPDSEYSLMYAAGSPPSGTLPLFKSATNLPSVLLHPSEFSVVQPKLRYIFTPIFHGGQLFPWQAGWGACGLRGWE